MMPIGRHTRSIQRKGRRNWNVRFGLLTLPLLILLALLSPSSADEQLETDDFRVAQRQAFDLAARHGADNVLVVCDIDNTLLTSNQDLGGNAWFDWQSDLLGREPGSPQLVAGNFDGLLDVQGALFALGGMHPPQSSQPELLTNLQQRKLAVIAHSSRSFSLRDATRRELRRAGYDLSKTAPAAATPSGPYLPFQPGRVAEAGLSAEEARRLGVGARPPRPVSYSEGVYMTAGQHKGAMLRMLLARSQRQFKALLFIDDSAKNIDAVSQAFTGHLDEVIAVRFSREDGHVQQFEQSDKRHVVQQWQELSSAIRPLLPGGALPELVAAPADDRAAPTAAPKLRLATVNCEFLLRGKVHMKYGLPFDTRDFTPEQKATWTDQYREARFRDATEAVATAIARLEADVVGLVEVGDGRDVADLRQALARRGAGYDHVAVCDSSDTATGQHVAVLSRQPLTDVRRKLPGRESYDRELDDAESEDDTGVSKAMRVTFEVAGQSVTLFVVHLSSERGGHEQDAQRIAQASIVRRHYEPLLRRGQHVIVAGDLNDDRGQPTLRRIRGRDDIGEDLIQTAGPTFFRRQRGESSPEYNARLRSHWSYEYAGRRQQLDHVLISGSLRRACVDRGVQVKFHTLPETVGRNPVTDHRAVAVDFSFRKPPQR